MSQSCGLKAPWQSHVHALLIVIWVFKKHHRSHPLPVVFCLLSLGKVGVGVGSSLWDNLTGKPTSAVGSQFPASVLILVGLIIRFVS